MLVTDPALVNPDTIASMPKLVVTDTIKYAAGIAGALLVLALGKIIAARHAAADDNKAGATSD